MVEEEGEVFRKGIVLLDPEEMDGDYAGEDLRREVCISFFTQEEKMFDTFSLFKKKTKLLERWSNVHLHVL